MADSLKEVNRLYKEFNEELDQKLDLIDNCLATGKECPCEMESCSIDIQKFQEMDEMHNNLLEKYMF